MKTGLIQMAIYATKFILDIIYAIMKIFPINNRKVLFCSRQSDDTPVDFLMIQKELKRKDINCVNICCHIEPNITDYMKFTTATLKSMYHLATGVVCILDSYWPAVSLLKHKRSLTVIQIWHALGKIKQSGYQTLGKRSGRNERYANLLAMHRNYDYVVAGSRIWNKYYCESFNIPEDRILNYGLPRIDYLLRSEGENRKRFFDKYPEMKGKRIILYAPTFRRNMKSHWERIIDEVKESDEDILIIKKHPGERVFEKKQAPNVYYMDEWKTLDLISVCDYFITDYSAAALEAAVLSKRTYYWTYDYEAYMRNNGLNLKLKEELGKYVFDDISELMKELRRNCYDEEFLINYRKKYLPDDLGHSTDKLIGLIMRIIDEAGE